MYPILKIGIFQIPLFQTLTLIGLLAFTITTILVLEKKENTQKKTVNRILLVCALSFPILVVSAFLANSLFHSIAEKKLVLGGITWLGGILVTLPIWLLFIHFFCPRIKGNALYYFNLLIPALALGHAFGRIGCFLGGCCYGGITDGVFGVSFPPHSSAAHQQVEAGFIVHGEWSLPVYPTQLFEAAFELLLFVGMMVFYKKLRGHFLETYCFGYGVFRFCLEFMRGDDRGSVGFFLSPSQLMSLILIVYGILLILYHKRIIFKKLHQKMDAYKKESEIYGVHLGQDVKSVLKKLHELKQNGMLTEEEYENAKNELEKRLYSPSQDKY
ncbi:MAG: prolipoprotein diacylglyceryl transferase [Clostridia bacterium]|nr:prolipoprotein diacylglyceryl transferase [Clostridia bacterium]